MFAVTEAEGASNELGDLALQISKQNVEGAPRFFLLLIVRCEGRLINWARTVKQKRRPGLDGFENVQPFCLANYGDIKT